MELQLIHTMLDCYKEHREALQEKVFLQPTALLISQEGQPATPHHHLNLMEIAQLCLIRPLEEASPVFWIWIQRKK